MSAENGRFTFEQLFPNTSPERASSLADSLAKLAIDFRDPFILPDKPVTTELLTELFESDLFIEELRKTKTASGKRYTRVEAFAAKFILTERLTQTQ